MTNRKIIKKKKIPITVLKNQLTGNLILGIGSSNVILPRTSHMALYDALSRQLNESKSMIKLKDLLYEKYYTEGVKTYKVGDKITIKYGGKKVKLPIRRVNKNISHWKGQYSDNSTYWILPPDREDLPGAEVAIQAKDILNESKLAYEDILGEGTPPKSIKNLVDRVNKYIAKADKDDIMAVEPDSTWESTYEFKPIKLSSRYVIFTYVDVYEPGQKTKVEKFSWASSDDWHIEEMNHMFNWIIRAIKKGYKEEGKSSPKF